MRVLVAIDGSKASEIVLQAVERPWLPGTRFCLITVVDPFFFTRAPILFEEAKEVASRLLEEAAEKYRKAGWETETRVVTGNPRRAISHFAEQWPADLVLVGSHGLNALERLTLGSTVRSVLRHTKCSVEVVRAPKKEPQPGARKILLATDGSEFSNAAVKAIAAEPWPKGTQIKVISVPEFALWLGEYPYFQRAQVPGLNESALGAANAAVALARDILSRAGFSVTTDVPVDQDAPAKTILSVAKEWAADLIVVGSHGRSGFDRWALGSVSESVAMNAYCSVEVVHLPVGREVLEHEGESHESERSHDVYAVHVS